MRSIHHSPFLISSWVECSHCTLLTHSLNIRICVLLNETTCWESGLCVIVSCNSVDCSLVRFQVQGNRSTKDECRSTPLLVSRYRSILGYYVVHYEYATVFIVVFVVEATFVKAPFVKVKFDLDATSCVPFHERPVTTVTV